MAGDDGRERDWGAGIQCMVAMRFMREERGIGDIELEDEDGMMKLDRMKRG